MATTAPTRNRSDRNPNVAVPTSSTPLRKQGPRPARKSRARPSPTPHLTSDQCARLLSVIEDAGGVTTIDAVARALPLMSQPVSAVFDLCDAGILNVDWESAFDGDMHVWRIDR